VILNQNLDILGHLQLPFLGLMRCKEIDERLALAVLKSALKYS